MPDRESVIKALDCCLDIVRAGRWASSCIACPYAKRKPICRERMLVDAITLLKEQEKKQITLHKNHVITLRRNDKFSMRELYEAICETLLDEGELFITRTDDHEKVDFVFYVAEGR